MPHVLTDLIIDRVDLVDEGANSAAFIELFKRKEKEAPMEFSEILSKMKPEHASVIQEKVDSDANELSAAREDLEKARGEVETLTTQLNEANDALAKANAELEIHKAKNCECDGEADDNGVCKVCGKPKKKGAGFDETEILKSMPEEARNLFAKMREQKEVAEEQVRKAAEEKRAADAVAKAATMKSLPIPQEELVEILKNSDAKIVEVLSAASAAIDAAVLGEVGKAHKESDNKDAWAKIEAKAEDIAKRDNVTKQKAIAIAINENPDLYKEYLNGGAN